MRMKGALSFVFLLISLYSLAQNLDDRVVLDWNQKRNIGNDNLFLGLSQSADYVAIAMPLTILASGFINENESLKRKGIESGIAILGTYGVGYILKKSIKRERPFLVLKSISPIQVKDSFSMPSGSASVAFATATSLTSTFPKWYVAVPSYAYASGVAYSRIRSGEHYPSDVLVGAAIGAASVWVSGKLMKWINHD